MVLLIVNLIAIIAIIVFGGRRWYSMFMMWTYISIYVCLSVCLSVRLFVNICICINILHARYLCYHNKDLFENACACLSSSIVSFRQKPSCFLAGDKCKKKFKFALFLVAKDIEIYHTKMPNWLNITINIVHGQSYHSECSGVGYVIQ